MSKCRCAFSGLPSEIDANALIDPDPSVISRGESALWLVLKESEAKKIVAAVENGHAYLVVAILKNQPWWLELSAAVRGLEYREGSL